MAEIRQEDRERVEYVAQMLAELSRMTDARRFPVLGHLIDMACLEARDIAEGGDGSTDGGKKRDAIA